MSDNIEHNPSYLEKLKNPMEVALGMHREAEIAKYGSNQRCGIPAVNQDYLDLLKDPGLTGKKLLAKRYFQPLARDLNSEKVDGVSLKTSFIARDGFGDKQIELWRRELEIATKDAKRFAATSETQRLVETEAKPSAKSKTKTIQESDDDKTIQEFDDDIPKNPKISKAKNKKALAVATGDDEMSKSVILATPPAAAKEDKASPFSAFLSHSKLLVEAEIGLFGKVQESIDTNQEKHAVAIKDQQTLIDKIGTNHVSHLAHLEDLGVAKINAEAATAGDRKPQAAKKRTRGRK